MGNVEVDNAIEEIKEISEKCVRCGMCKSLCPFFLVLREEYMSPRGKTMMLDKDVYEKIIYDCTLCKACEQKCPLNLKVCEQFRKARKVLVGKGKETKENKEMMKNVEKFGNPFGQLTGKVKKLYCC